MGKYDELSGKGAVLSVTPMGLLDDIIMETDVKIYLDNSQSYSLNLVEWGELNKGLYKELLAMSEYCENVIFVKDENERLRLLKGKENE